MKKFRGTYTVLITPFTADGKKVDEPARMDQVRQGLLAVLNGGAPRQPSAPARSLSM